MHEIHLWATDLNLLVILDVLLREQSVTRAARRLGRTQSAVSHALGRLRDLLGDELLIRDGRRMRLTARAAILAVQLPRTLDQVRRTLAPPEIFDASASTRTFRLAAPDFAVALLPPLLQRFAVEAPHARIELVGAGPGMIRDLADGRCDAVIGPESLAGEGVRSERLWVMDWAVFMRRDHPARRCWSLDAWAAAPHLQIRTAGGDGPVDQAAQRLGIRRSVAAVLPGFAPAPAILVRTDLLLTVPRLALEEAAEPFSLHACPAPLPLPPMSLALHRDAALGDEPGVRWFLDQIRSVAARPGVR